MEGQFCFHAVYEVTSDFMRVFLRIPRLVFHSDGELKQQSADDRMALKLPEEGFVSNPSDMHAVELLTQVALYIASTIRYEYTLRIPGASESVDVNLKSGLRVKS
jgi:hypothetical protein